jgi:hypothetical protein
MRRFCVVLFKHFQYGEIFQGVAPFVALQNIFGNRNHPVWVTIFGVVSPVNAFYTE